MNLSKLFPIQKKLDERIVKEKGLEGQDLLPEKILALQVELGELANEWRGFKFWSENQASNVRVLEVAWGKAPHLYMCQECNGEFHVEEAKELSYECDLCMSKLFGVVVKNPLLEEYVDCLHFILSIGNDINLTSRNYLAGLWYSDPTPNEEAERIDVTVTFSMIFKNTWNVHADYRFLVAEFLDLGSKLGFTWDQIEQAYYDKNEINHARQENGY